MPLIDPANAASLAEAYELPGNHGNVMPFLIVRVRLAKTPDPGEVAAYNQLIEAFQVLDSIVQAANQTRDKEAGRQS